jgi:hypothetical protein
MRQYCNYENKIVLINTYGAIKGRFHTAGDQVGAHCEFPFCLFVPKNSSSCQYCHIWSFIGLHSYKWAQGQSKPPVKN